jgi:hypothetical protein
MNNTFEFGRFARLYQKHTVEHLKSYLLSAAVLAGLLFVWLGFMSYTHSGKLSIRDQSVTFVFFFLLCGTIFTSLTFNYLGDKKKAIPILTLPVSNFEKYLVSWIYTFVVYQLVFVGVFFLIDGTLFGLGAAFEKDENEIINIFSIDQRIYVSFIAYVILHAFAFLGAIYFRKLHFIKTSFAVFAAAFSLTVIDCVLIRAFIVPNARRTMPFMGISVIDHDMFYNVNVGGQGFALYVAGALAVIAILLWTAAYYKLKEKEV